MKTKRILPVIILFALLTGFSSCDELFDERIEGNEVLTTKIRDISDFSEIVSLGDFNIYITQADSTSLRLVAEENLIPFIITKVSDNTLFIEEKEGFSLNSNLPINIYVSTPYLREVDLLGSGIIACDSLSGSYFDANLLGSGNIEFENLYMDKKVNANLEGSGHIILSGEGVETDYEILGSGSIKAIDFIHQESESFILGSGNIYVYAQDYLKAVISGSGNIYYKGDPEIDEHITGTGDVRRY